MTTRVELPNPGDSLTMLVTACGKATAGNFPGIEFSGQDGSREVIIELPEATVNRQFVRLEQNYKSIVGKTITLSRSLKLAANGKPFWDIDVVGQGNGAPPASSSVSAPARAQESALQPAATDPTAVPDRLPALFNLHRRCFRHVLSLQDPTVVLSPDAISALTAQVFIAANEQGIR